MYRCHWNLSCLSRWVRMRGWYYSTCSDMQSRILLLFELDVYFWVLCVYLFSWIRIHFNHQHRMYGFRCNVRSLFTWDLLCGWYCSTLCVYLLSWICIHYDSQHRLCSCRWNMRSLPHWERMYGWYCSTCCVYLFRWVCLDGDNFNCVRHNFVDVR